MSNARALVAQWERDALVNVLSQGERAVLRNCTSALREALAAEGVQAGEVECDCPGKGKDDPALHAPNCPARLSQQPEARGVVDGWALTKLRAHETRCENCGRAVWDRKDPNNCIGFIAPCGKRVARLEDCGTADCTAALTEARNVR